jgi:hypothetical protein
MRIKLNKAPQGQINLESFLRFRNRGILNAENNWLFKRKNRY